MNTPRNREMDRTANFTHRSVCVAARFSSLPDLVALLDIPSINHRIVARARLAVEELFANTIHHGYREACDLPVWLSVEHSENALKVCYADAAPEFNPFEDIPGPFEESEFDLDTHQVGGLGRILTYQMAGHSDYRREEGRNVVTLEYGLSPSG